MQRLPLVIAITVLFTCLATSAQAEHPYDEHAWNKDEIKVMRGLWLASLPPLPADPSNKYADDSRAVALGKKIFNDVRFSGNKKVACATCHRPDYGFTDDLPLAHGLGFTRRRSMPLAGLAYSPWLFWDGRKDSLWSQALGPIESKVEHGISRTLVARLIYANYRSDYEGIFGPLPEFLNDNLVAIARPAADDPEAQAAWDAIKPEEQRHINIVYANTGKAVAAYVRQILPGPSPFDRYVAALTAGNQSALAKIFTTNEALGLRLFIGKAKCINCHNGPLFTNFDFHNVGVAPVKGGEQDEGRAEGIDQVRADEFNCLGVYSDAGKRDCAELRFMDKDKAKFRDAFKTPSLRNVAQRPPYMHAGQFSSLQEVLHHYSTVKPNGLISPELTHQGMSAAELLQIEAFLGSLTGEISAP